MGEHRVVEREVALELRALERVERAGGVRAQRQLGAGEVAGGAQQRERQLVAVVDHLVLEQAVVQQRQSRAAGGGVDEAA